MAIVEKIAKKISVGIDFLKNLSSIKMISDANLRLIKTVKNHKLQNCPKIFVKIKM